MIVEILVKATPCDCNDSYTMQPLKFCIASGGHSSEGSQGRTTLLSHKQKKIILFCLYFLRLHKKTFFAFMSLSVKVFRVLLYIVFKCYWSIITLHIIAVLNKNHRLRPKSFAVIILFYK